MNTSRRRPVWVGLIGVVLAFVIAEIALARLGRMHSFLAYSESRGWRLRPGVAGWYEREGRAWVSINLDGLRGPHVPVAKPPGAWRVAVLGDSFVQAIHVPYEQTFTAVLERELRGTCPTRRGRPIEVLNFGVSGYGTAQQLLTLREQVLRYEPDLVVLAIFTGNDISDNSRALDAASFFTGERCRPYFREQDGELVVEGPFGAGLLPWYCRANFEGRRFAVLQLLGETVTAAAAIGETHGEAGDGMLGREPGIDDAIYAPPQSDAWRDAWEITERLIATIAREVQDRRPGFLATILSNPIQVHPDAAHRARYLAAVGGTDLLYPDGRIQALGAREGFEVLALAPRMQREADRRRLFFHGFHNTKPGVGHWNAAGHDFAGRAIASTICGSRRYGLMAASSQHIDVTGDFGL